MSIVLVVSPLVSLMVDQVTALRSTAVGAAILRGAGGRLTDKLLVDESDIERGKFSLLFGTPEASETWRELLLGDRQVVAVVAHCVYKWYKITCLTHFIVHAHIQESKFRPPFARLHELRSLVSPGIPMIALTATVTRADVITRLNLKGCECVSVSPNHPNILYSVSTRLDIETDFSSLVKDLENNCQVIVYCHSLNTCFDLYGYFRYHLGNKGYYPPGSEEICRNRIFGMFHSSTSDANKQVILESLSNPDGTVRVVFTTTALGIGANLVALRATIHYGAPRSLDDYFHESGSTGRAGEFSTSIIYWKPVDAPSIKSVSSTRDAEVIAVQTLPITEVL